MFFTNRINLLKPEDRVLEIGPGATPHPRADVFLEKIFDTEQELIAQSGHVGILKTDKPIITYKGDIFPFKDKEFDYVICTHVLEHVENIDFFVKEVTRIANRGYFEFPTIYYEYLFNIEEHLNVLFYDGRRILWTKKKNTPISDLKRLTDFFRTAQFKGYRFQEEMNDAWHHGFEWTNSVELLEVNDWTKLCYDPANLSGVFKKPSAPRVEKMGVKYGFGIMLKSLIKKIKK